MPPWVHWGVQSMLVAWLSYTTCVTLWFHGFSGGGAGGQHDEQDAGTGVLGCAGSVRTRVSDGFKLISNAKHWIEWASSCFNRDFMHDV